jgi:hypothetical protein
MEIEWWRKQQTLGRDDVIKKAVPKVDAFQYFINSTNSYVTYNSLLPRNWLLMVSRFWREEERSVVWRIERSVDIRYV